MFGVGETADHPVNTRQSRRSSSAEWPAHP
jgi:hypothetical protein